MWLIWQKTEQHGRNLVQTHRQFNLPDRGERRKRKHALNVYFHFFNKNRQQSRNSGDTHHFSRTINKISCIFPTKLIPQLSMSVRTLFMPCGLEVDQSILQFPGCIRGINMWKTHQTSIEHCKNTTVRPIPCWRPIPDTIGRSCTDTDTGNVEMTSPIAWGKRMLHMLHIPYVCFKT